MEGGGRQTREVGGRNGGRGKGDGEGEAGGGKDGEGERGMEGWRKGG